MESHEKEELSFIFSHPEFHVPYIPSTVRCVHVLPGSDCSCIEFRIGFKISLTSSGLIPVSLRSIKICVARYWNTYVPESEDFTSVVDWKDVLTKLVVAFGWKPSDANAMTSFPSERKLLSLDTSKNEKTYIWKELMCCMIKSNGIPSFYHNTVSLLYKEYSHPRKSRLVHSSKPNIINDHWKRTPPATITVKDLDPLGYYNSTPITNNALSDVLEIFLPVENTENILVTQTKLY